MHLATKLRQRLANEESGFTLIELLVVLVIIGILLAIAVPSYLGFKDRAERKAAAANVRAGIPSVEAWYSDKGSYTGMDETKLKASYDAGLANSFKVVSTTAIGYCVKATQGKYSYYLKGPAGTDNISTAVCT